jgi:chromosomal replication initiator protein
MDWFEEHIRARAKKDFLNNNLRPIKIHLTCNTHATLDDKSDKPTQNAHLPYIPTQDSLLTEYNKSQFIFSKGNIILEKLLSQIISLDSPPFNPIFLYGGACVGKTHLLQALAQELEKKHSQVLYLRAETFTENLVKAIRSGQMLEFRKFYRNVDILLVDDVQHLGKKNATQEEFFHTFNTLHNQNKQIILSANVAPGALQYIEPRLISRFEWGLSLPITKLDEEDLMLMVENRGRQLGLSLTEASRQFVVEEFSANPKSIHKALEALYLRASSYRKSLSPPKIQLILKDLLEAEKKAVLSPDKILASVAEFYGLSCKDIFSKSQTQECTTPRQVAMFLCRTHLKIPFTKIGEYFGRDHSTVIASVRLIEEKMQIKDHDISNAIATIGQKMQQ